VISDDLRIANRRAQAYSSKLAQDAVTDVMGAMGAGGLFLDQPIQRYWRDVQAGAAHFGINWDAMRIMCGQFALGLEPELKYY
jgi:3-hydroxy-9,10-secoandrosta-1,3,5(10)-triene-9,17-dione monooxygenase